MADEENAGMDDFIDNEEEVDERTHEKLLNSIFALDGKKRQKTVVRGLPSTSSNVDLLVHGKTSKIKPEDLKLKPKKAHSQLKKPKSGLETEKAQRQIARESLVSEMTKWDPIVHEIRAAPQTVFSNRPHGMKMYAAVQPNAFTPRTPLEKEIYEALGKSEDIMRPNEEMTVAETKALKAMSVKEAKQRRAELLRHHELLSRVELKAKWQNKIKSKRYRKILRKEKVTAEKKLLEQLQKTDPEAFLEKLDQIEKARMEERLTLKHRGGSKFSRMHKAYSKFDDKTREAVQEMLQKSRELTKKRQDASSSDDDGDNNNDNSNTTKVVVSECDDDNIEDGEGNKAKHDLSKAVSKKAGGWLDVPNTTFVFVKPQTESILNDQDVHNEKSSMSELPSEIMAMEESEQEPSRVETSKDADVVKQSVRKSSKSSDHVEKSKRKSKINASLLQLQKSAEEIEHLEDDDSEEDQHLSTDMHKVSHRKENKSLDKKDADNELNKKKRDKKNKGNNQDRSAVGQEKKPVKEIILQVVSENAEDEDKDEDSDDGMQVTMEELFEDEDVVEQFAKEKAEAEERGRPKLEDTKLPGWGSWAGPDYKNNKHNERQKKKAIAKARHLQRQQQKIKQPNVWINPNRDEAIRKLQPKIVPFPYTSVQQYEASLRQPVSRGFVRETAFKLLTKPEIVTKLGHIIKPLDKEDFFQKKEVDNSMEGEDEKVGSLYQEKGRKGKRRSIR